MTPAPPALPRDPVTSVDVARLAGVSQATVSLTLNGHASRPRVSRETRERVMAAAAQLGYAPNHAARSLRSRRTRILTFVLRVLDSPYHGEVIGAAKEVARAHGYAAHVVPAADEDEEVQALDHLGSGVSDGVVTTARTERVLAKLEAVAARGLAAVIVQDDGRGTGLPSVRVDLEGGGYDATRHLLGLGHRRIGHLVDARAYTHRRSDRTGGYRRALADAGVTPEPDWIAAGANSFEGGYRAMRQLMAAARPTAVFAFNDPMAVGALRAAAEAGLRVPEDVALVSFDGIELSAFTNPPLTTVEHPRRELGRLAVERLLDQIAGRAPDGRSTVLPTRLVVRTSCGARAWEPSGGGAPPG